MHEDAVILRVDHCRPIPKQRAFAQRAWIMRENRDPPFAIRTKKAKNQFVNQRGLARSARSAHTNHERRTSRPGSDNLVGEAMHDLLARRHRAPAAIAFLNKSNHLIERGPREKNPIHSATLHDDGVRFRNGASSAAEYSYMLRVFLPKKREDLGKEFHVSAIVARDPNCSHVLLDGGARDVPGRSVIAEIDYLDPVTDEFHVNCEDRAVVSVTNRHRCQNPDRFRHMPFTACRPPG